LSNDYRISQKIDGVRNLLGIIADNTEGAENSFKDAIRDVSITTVTLLTALPNLKVFLIEGRLCTATILVWDIIQKVSNLLNVLEQAKVPILALKNDLGKLVSELQILTTTLQAAQIEIQANMEIFAKDQKDYEQSWFGGAPDVEKHKQMLVTNSHLSNMVSTTDILTKYVDPAEIQIQVAIDHLKSIKSNLWDAYKSLMRTLDQLQKDGKTRLDEYRPVCGDETIYLTNEEKTDVMKGIDKVIEHITLVQQKNDPVLKQISVLGFAAIKAD